MKAVEFPTQFAQLFAGVLLLGVMMRQGVFGRDKLFTAYLIAFIAALATLWIVAQAWRDNADRRVDYTILYHALHFATLCMAGMLAQKHAGLVLLLTSPLVIAMSVAAWKYGAGWSRLEGVAAGVMLWLAIGVLTAASFQGDSFDRAKLAGLGLFWLSNGLVSALYWTFYEQQPKWANVTTTLAGIGGVVAFAWMLAAFSGQNIEGARQGSVAAQQVERSANQEAQ